MKARMPKPKGAFWPPRGFCRSFVLDERTGLLTPRGARHNQIQDWSGYIACLALGRGGVKLNTFYLEFENVAAPGDPVAAPAFDTSEGIEYYQGLSGDRDYLRVPIRGEPSIEIASGFEEVFTNGVNGNKLVFVGMSSGTAGVNGLPFSDSANSTIFGMALVAALDPTDAARDLVFGRMYWTEAAEQVPKEPSKQVVVSWEQSFTLEG